MLKPYDQLSEIRNSQHAEEIDHKINSLGANSRELKAVNWLKREHLLSLCFSLIVVLAAMYFIFESGNIGGGYRGGLSFGRRQLYDFLTFQAVTILAVPTIAYIIRAILVSNRNSCIDLLNRFINEQQTS